MPRERGWLDDGLLLCFFLVRIGETFVSWLSGGNEEERLEWQKGRMKGEHWRKVAEDFFRLKPDLSPLLKCIPAVECWRGFFVPPWGRRG